LRSKNLNPKLVVPSDPVVTSTGHDVLLPCHLSPEKSAVPMEIRWFRDKYLEFVFLYQAGKEERGKGYEGRVSLFPQELLRGNVSLLLRDVKLNDGGEYKCHVSFSSWYEEPIVRLTVRRK
uniref:Ig-like domain-containing protein n=1 Tax=Scleropages formosus TaxID=113540 RepID=A0A8C9RYI3_SCLFO